MKLLSRIAAAVALLTAFVVIGMGSCWLGMRPPSPPEPPARSLTLRNVTLLQPGHPGEAARREARSLVVRNGRIAEIGPARPVEGDRYAGAFVMPGLIDMHVHWPPAAIPGQTELFSFLHLYHGVTTVRSMGDTFEGASVHAREVIEEGRFLGPRVFSCGPIVDGDPPLWQGSRVVRNAEEATQAVHEIAMAGFDCVKAYDGLSEESVIALREAAIAAGLPIVGHTPRRVRFEVAKLQDIQHLRGVHPPFPGETPPYPRFLAAWLEAGDDHDAFIVRESLANDLAHTPTLVTLDRLVRSRDASNLAAEPVYRMLPRWYRDALWDPERGLNAARLMDDADFDMVAAALGRMKLAVRSLHEAGVAIHVGSDTMAPGVVPGAALHRELQLLVEAGLSPSDALAAATTGAARFLDLEGGARIEPGAPADLVILREDPTRDLAALASLAGVIRDGRLYSRDVLDTQMERFRDGFDGIGQRWFLTEALRLAFGRLLPMLVVEGPTTQGSDGG